MDDAISLLLVYMYLACTVIYVSRFKDKYFDPCLASKLETRLEVWPGFATAVNALEDGVFLQLDVSYKVLQNSTVLDQVKNALTAYKTGLWRRWTFYTKVILFFIDEGHSWTIQKPSTTQ